MFDHSWADAYYSYGYDYYPKLQSCVPFTPVTGQRILVKNISYKEQVFLKLLSALKDLTSKVVYIIEQNSEVYCTFSFVLFFPQDNLLIFMM